MMIGEGTFGALSGGAVLGGLAYKGGEDADSITSESLLGATIGAGAILGLRGGIARHRMNKALTGFKKSDPRFTQYVDDITNKESRLEHLNERLQGTSYDGLKEQEFQALRSAMSNPQMPINFQDVEQSIPQLRKRLNLKTSEKSSIVGKKGEQRKLQNKMRNIEKRLRTEQKNYVDDLIDQGESLKNARSIAKLEFDQIRNTVLGKPKRDLPIPEPAGRQISPATGIKTVPRTYLHTLPSRGLEEVIRNLRVPQSLTMADAVASIYGANAVLPASAKAAIVRARGGTGANRIIGKSRSGVKFGFMPHYKTLNPIHQGRTTNAFGPNISQNTYDVSDLNMIKRLQEKQGLGYQVERLEDRVRSADRAIGNLKRQINTRQNLVKSVNQNVQALRREPGELKNQLSDLRKNQQEYLNNFINQKEQAIKSSFLGLGG